MAVPGLTFKSPLNEVTDDQGNVVTPGTHGILVRTSILSDKAILMTTVSLDYWRVYGNLKVIGGVQGDFLDPPSDGSEGLLGTTVTSNFGVNGALRFNAKGLPAQLAGSYSWDVDGVDNEVGSVSVALVTEF
jgi:hypothetical protein